VINVDERAAPRRARTTRLRASPDGRRPRSVSDVSIGSVKFYDDYLRWLYRGGRPNRFARLQNRVSAFAFAAGLGPKRAATLEVRGRRTGRDVSFPVVIADYEGERYVVAMLGGSTSWVRNVRAADGRAVLRHGRREDVRLEEIPAERRAAILRRYLSLAPGARPHIPVDRHAALEEFERLGPQVPVFLINTAPSVKPSPTG